MEMIQVKFTKDEEIINDENDSEETPESQKQQVASAQPKINIVVSTYYKGTALEGLTKKLEEYLDNAPKSENTINFL